MNQIQQFRDKAREAKLRWLVPRRDGGHPGQRMWKTELAVGKRDADHTGFLRVVKGNIETTGGEKTMQRIG